MTEIFGINHRRMKKLNRKPPWLKKRIPAPSGMRRMREILHRQNLHTVCESARCPNIGECFAKPTATFMILGDLCTRACRFCGVEHGSPGALDPNEPRRVAETARGLGLKHVIITSVTRDDLPDGGAEQFACTIRQIRRFLTRATVEVLTPDFMGSMDALGTVLNEKPDIFNHNLETVKRLYPAVRPQAQYDRSLKILAQAKRLFPGIKIKSGAMVGLGESPSEIFELMKDLRSVGCDILTIGQYLQPTRVNLPVSEYIHPELFEEYARKGYELGFEYVFSAPFARSSFNAEDYFNRDL